MNNHLISLEVNTAQEPEQDSEEAFDSVVLAIRV